MTKDEILIKCNGTSEIDVSPASLNFYQTLDGTGRDIRTGGYEIGIRCTDYTIYESCRVPGAPDIKRVIFSDPCTIVLWNDGSKTIVRCTDEKFDKEKGLAMCVAKKALGNKGKYYDVFKKWLKPEYDSSPIEELRCSFTQCKWYKNPDYRRCNDCKKKQKERHTKKR